MANKYVPLLIIFMLVSSLNCAWGDSRDEEEKVYAVQNRVFHRNHEIDLYGGYLSGDDFFHVYPVGIGYTYHFNEHISWEVARAQYLLNSEKGLKNSLEEEFGVTPEEFPEQRYMIHSHLMFKPLYGKSALLNRKVTNHETYLFGGAGVVNYEWQYSTGETRTENALSLSFGAGMRYFLTKRFCLNIEVRDLVNFMEDDTKNYLAFGLGVGFRFNLGPRRVEEDPTAKKIKSILDEN